MTLMSDDKFVIGKEEFALLHTKCMNINVKFCKFSFLHLDAFGIGYLSKV